MPMRPAFFSAVRAATVAALLTSIGIAHADDYSDVSQLVRDGKTAQAIELADRYLGSNPRDPQMRFLKGTAQAAAGNTQEALETFTLLTQEYPELPEPYNNIAVIHAAANRLGQAREALEMAVRNNPNYAVAHENLGDIYVRLAQQSYARSLQLRSTNSTLQRKQTALQEMLGHATPAVKP